MNTDLPRKRKRRRGVVASRTKLAQAMYAAGIKTQAALANKIADIEGSDQSQKDVVNRAFRELPVEMRTIERIAKALGTSASALLKTEEDAVQAYEGAAADTADKAEAEFPAVDFLSTSSRGDSSIAISSVEDSAPAGVDQHFSGPAIAIAPQKNSVYLSATRMAGLAVFLALSMLGAIQIYKNANSNRSVELARVEPFRNMQPALGKFSIAVIATNPELHPLVESLEQKLDADFQSTSLIVDSQTHDLVPGAISREYGADLVLLVKTETYGRHQGLTVELYGNSYQTLIWSESQSHGEFARDTDGISGRIAQAVRFSVGTAPSAGGFFPEVAAQREYLRGRAEMDKSTGPNHLKVAQGHFSAAVRHSPNFGLANAGLCETSVLESWRDDIKEALIDARGYCDKARELNPQHVYSDVAWIAWLRVSGQLEEALDAATSAMARHPHSIELMTERATVELELFRKNTDPQFLQQSIERATAAWNADPSYWRAASVAGTGYFLRGDLDRAIEQFERVVALSPVDLAHTNLGTMYLCRDNLDKAVEHFTKVRNINPESYIGDEFLGSAYYFAGNFDQSLQHRQAALAKAGSEANIHQMWGGLADAHLHVANLGEAKRAYQQAIKIIERDQLLGVAAAQDPIYQAYYLLQLKNLSADQVTTDRFYMALAQAQSSAHKISDAPSLLKYAQLCVMQNDMDCAVEFLNKATRVCSVYKRLPEFRNLLTAH